MEQLGYHQIKAMSRQTYDFLGSVGLPRSASTMCVEKMPSKQASAEFDRIYS